MSGGCTILLEDIPFPREAIEAETEAEAREQTD